MDRSEKPSYCMTAGTNIDCNSLMRKSKLNYLAELRAGYKNVTSSPHSSRHLSLNKF